MAAVEDGLYQPSMKARMDELERQKAEITERLAQAPADVPDVHPNVANVYGMNVTRFTEALDDPDGGREAAQALRSLIGEIVLTPGEKRGEVHAELRGELMGILEFVNAKGTSNLAILCQQWMHAPATTLERRALRQPTGSVLCDRHSGVAVLGA